MKEIFENWRRYLISEQSEIFGYTISPEQRVVITNEPFTDFRNIKQEPPRWAGGKPDGLWYACGDEWLEFINTSLRGPLARARYIYEIKLSDKVLKIDNDLDFKTFYYHFRTQTFVDPSHPAEEGDAMAIDWPEVQREGYAGVEVCPYLGSMRTKFDWYYGWDVASGCVWDSAGVTSVSLLASRQDVIE